MEEENKSIEKKWKKIEKELEYVASYANPERRAELLHFLKGEFQELSILLIQELLEKVKNLKKPLRNKWITIDERIRNDTLNNVISSFSDTPPETG